MGAEPLLFYEDLEPGGGLKSAVHVVDREELVSFARVWDPLPFHVDEEAGLRAFGGLTAPGLFALAIKQRLVHSLAPLAVIASLGYDEVRFHEPLRPGTKISLNAGWLTRRMSNSKPDRGIVTIRFTLVDDMGRIVMSHLDTVLVRLRSPRPSPLQNSAAFASS